jgi:glyoxylase I family protein
MKIKLHHLNLCSKDVAGMEAFYRSVLDLEPEPSLNSARHDAGLCGASRLRD